MRVLIEASKENGLNKNSYVMADKIVTVKKTMLGEKIGYISEQNMTEIPKNLKTILGLN